MAHVWLCLIVILLTFCVQKFREEVHKAKMEAESLDRILLEKQADAEICRKELELQKTEVANLNQRISEVSMVILLT